MATTACPLGDDRGTCKTISLQFGVCPLALFIRSMVVLCLKELRREERQRDLLEGSA